MKRWMFALGLLLCVRGAAAQERVPDEEAKMVAPVLVEAAAKVKPPIKVEVDVEKPYGKHKDEFGAMLLPKKELATAAIDKAGAAIVPVGQLWLRGLTLVAEEKVLSSKKMHMLPVTYKERELNLSLCYLGVQKVKDRLSLVVLSKEATPLVTLPLEKIDSKQEYPLEFLVTIDPDERATLTILVQGKYRTKLRVAPLAD